MSRCVIVVLIFVLMSRESFAKEMSLLETTMLPQLNTEQTDDQFDSDEEDVSEPLENDETKEEYVQDDDFEAMNDFIHEENERAKDIKLLSLDLEKAGLILKKKEIEQKIELLRRPQNGDLLKTDEDQESKSVSKFKLISVFVSSSVKKAILNINGVNYDFKEGQQIGDITVASIEPEKVVIKLSNGLTQDIYFI